MQLAKSIPVKFKNNEGIMLSGIIEIPETPIAFGIYAHCFTCTKNITAAYVISKTLAEFGYATLRFDFAGLGDSEGDFSKTSLTTNINDILKAFNFLKQAYETPRFLVGHSLGGLASLYASRSIPELKSCATINAPSNMKHFEERISAFNDADDVKNYALDIMGKKYLMDKNFVYDIKQYFDVNLFSVNHPTLVMHLSNDDIVPYAHSDLILNSVSGAKKRITLKDMNHLLTRRVYCEEVVHHIVEWLQENI